MRETLIELLKDSPSLVAMDDDGYAKGADHLIANGVKIPVRCGHWVTEKRTGFCYCSECLVSGSPRWKVCPVCEAKMVGERIVK